MDIGMTLLGQALSFAILIWFTVKFIWPPLMAAIEERQQKIAEGLAAADRSKKDLAQAEEKVNDVLREARGKASEIITQAEARRAQIIDLAKEWASARTVAGSVASRESRSRGVEESRSKNGRRRCTHPGVHTSIGLRRAS